MSQFYFAFGSNMKCSRLEKRLGDVIDHGAVSLQGYQLIFNKKSTDGSGKANIMPAEQEHVFGVLYELTECQLSRLDGIEKKYQRVCIEINWKGETKEVQTYVADETSIDNTLSPTAKYLSYLIDGADEHRFLKEYQEFLKSFEVVNET